MNHSKKPVVKMVRVIRDVRDYRRDYKIPLTEAQKLYAEGKLSWDCINGTYLDERK